MSANKPMPTKPKPTPEEAALKEIAKQSEEPSAAEEVVNYPDTVKAFGRSYEIKRFSVGQLIRALPYISPISYVLISAQQFDIATLTSRILATVGEPALGLVSVAISEPSEWIEEQDDSIGAFELLAAVVDKNAKYFFEPENVARLKAAFDRLQSTIQKHGGATSTS